MIQIDKNVPIPQGNLSKYPFPMMEAGDSFAVPRSERARVASAAIQYAKNHDGCGKFIVKQINDVCRCWLVK